MKIPLAWRNLVHNKVRTVVAVAGVAFAVVLVFMQLGFRGAVISTATLIYDALDFDVLVRSVEYISFADARSFPISRLPAAAGAPGVESVAPLYVQINQWRNPHDGSRRAILVLGISPSQRAFEPDEREIRGQTRRLTSPEYALIDRSSRSEFGPANFKKFGDADVGLETNVGEAIVKIIGHYDLGAGLAADGSLITSDRGFVRITPFRTLEGVSFGLVKLRPGADDEDRERAAKTIARLLPEDVEVLTRNEAKRRETYHWLNETPIGLIFQMGVGISLIVGVAIVYQVLSSDVAAHLQEYATLKAMGYTDHTLARVVLSQALILSLLGYVPGLIVSLLLYGITSVSANIPIEMTWPRVWGVLLLTVAMCAASGIAALRKVRVADPAELF